MAVEVDFLCRSACLSLGCWMSDQRPANFAHQTAWTRLEMEPRCALGKADSVLERICCLCRSMQQLSFIRFHACCPTTPAVVQFSHPANSHTPLRFSHAARCIWGLGYSGHGLSELTEPVHLESIDRSCLPGGSWRVFWRNFVNCMPGRLCQVTEENCSVSTVANTTDHVVQTWNLAEGAYCVLFVTALYLCMHAAQIRSSWDNTVSGVTEIVVSVLSTRTRKSHAK